MTEPKPSEKMASIGIVQEGGPILREVAQPFDLPAGRGRGRSRVVAEPPVVSDRQTGLSNGSVLSCICDDAPQARQGYN